MVIQSLILFLLLLACFSDFLDGFRHLVFECFHLVRENLGDIVFLTVATDYVLFRLDIVIRAWKDECLVLGLLTWVKLLEVSRLRVAGGLRGLEIHRKG